METKRLILFFVLSFGVMLGWGYLVAPTPEQIKQRKLEKKRRALALKMKNAAKHKKNGTPAKLRPANRRVAAATSQPSSRPTTQAASPTSKKVVARTTPASKAAKLPPKPVKTLTFENEKLYRLKLSNQGGGISSLLMKTFYDPQSKSKKTRLNLFEQNLKKTLRPFSERFLDKRLPKHGFVYYSKPTLISKSPIKYQLIAQIPSTKGGHLLVKKTYTFLPNKYRFRVDYQLTNKTSHAISSRVGLILHDFKDPKTLKPGGWFSAPQVYQLVCQVEKDSQPKRLDFEKLPKSKPFEGSAFFAGIDRRYFMTAIIPHWGNKDKAGGCHYSSSKEGYTKLEIQDKGIEIAQGASHAFFYSGYAGPKYYTRLRQADKQARLEYTIDFGIFAFLCRPMLWLLQFFYNLLLQIGFANWGVSIILLTLLIKLLTWPLTKTSMKSMKAMQTLKPELDKLKEKYGDDKESIQKETMNLYMKHGINPLSGCLPMLVQMPIWIALYNTLFYSVELYQAPFIPGWINDLSAADPIFVLPVLLGASMFMQQKLTPQTGMDPTQAKIMGIMMPAMFTVFMFFLPAGLTLYILVNTVLSIAHQWHVYNTPDEPPSDKPRKKSQWMERMKNAMEQQQKR